MDIIIMHFSFSQMYIGKRLICSLYGHIGQSYAFLEMSSPHNYKQLHPRHASIIFCGPVLISSTGLINLTHELVISNS